MILFSIFYILQKLQLKFRYDANAYPLKSEKSYASWNSIYNIVYNKIKINKIWIY